MTISAWPFVVSIKSVLHRKMGVFARFRDVHNLLEGGGGGGVRQWGDLPVLKVGSRSTCRVIEGGLEILKIVNVLNKNAKYAYRVNKILWNKH